MTELENTDSLENVTVTSDAAFERVTSDIKMEEWEDWWYLKQNTAWLVQEIPNISILDISDFLIENKKTLYDRQNWTIVVGKAGKSIEAQPQDICYMYTNTQVSQSGLYSYVEFENIDVSSNEKLCFYPQTTGWHSAIRILKEWWYQIQYSYQASISSSNNYYIDSCITVTPDWWSLSVKELRRMTLINWYTSYSDAILIHLDEWDLVWLWVRWTSDGSTPITWNLDWAHLSINYLQQSL